MNIKVDPTRVAIALGLVGSSLIAGIALLLTDQFSFFFKVAAVSLIILSLLGYVVGVLIKELHEEYLNFKGVVLKKHALKIPMLQKVPLRTGKGGQEADDDALDLEIDYSQEKESFADVSESGESGDDDHAPRG